MENRMDMPQPEKNGHLTATAVAVGKVIGALQQTRKRIFHLQRETFNVQDLTPEEFRELKHACKQHLGHLVPGLDEETDA